MRLRTLSAFGLSILVVGLASQAASAAVTSNMVTAPGSSATVTVTVNITTSLGPASDSDTRVIATTGNASAAFVSNSPPFSAAQLNAMQLNFANTTFQFQFYCLPFIGCAFTLNVAVNNLQFALVEPNCASIGAGGSTTFAGTVFHSTGTYSTSGSATASGAIDGTAVATFGARVTNPASGTVKFDQLTIANQTFVVPPENLPSGVSAMSFTVQTNLTNTTLSGPFAISPNSYDADGDGVLDYCDACTDTDGDGFGDPGFPHNTCAIDNCPDAFNPAQTDTDGNGIGDACDTQPCPADIAPKGGGDGLVNVDDLLVLLGAWGPAPGNPADLNGDGAVDVDDLLVLLAAWGGC